MKDFKILTIFFLLALSSSAFAQNPEIKKADKLFKLNQYAGAIDLYKAGLEEEQSLAAQTKLAYCYRMTNQMEAAEETYSEIVQNERARTITWFYYAESLMANQKYDEAKGWFLKYAETNPNDDRAPKMAIACDEVKSLKPVYTKVNIHPFTENSEVDDSGPVYFRDGIVFTSDRKSGINPLKQKSGWTGRDYLQIYFSAKDASGKYQKPTGFSSKLNEINKHCGPATFNAELTTTVFTRTSSHPDKTNTYNMQLYAAESSNGNKWKKVKTLPFCRKEHNYMHPALSPDGKVLFFVSDKPGGEGGTDIYKSERTSKGWSRPLNLGVNINTAANEGFPFFSTEGQLYFCSKGHSGYGGFDIFRTEQDEKGLWAKPVNIGIPINSSYDDISFHLNENGLEGMLSSNRDGGDDDIFLFNGLEKTIESDLLVAEQEEFDSESPKESASNVETVVEDGKITNQLKTELRADENANDPRLPQQEEMSAETLGAINEVEEPEIVHTKETNLPKEFRSPAFIEETTYEKENPDKLETPIEQIVKNEPAPEINSENELQPEITEPEGAKIETITENSKTSEIIDAEIKYDLKTPYKGSAVQIIPDDTFTSKGKAKPEISDEQMPDLRPATPEKPAASPFAPEMMYERPDPTVYPLAQMNFLLKKETPVKGKTFRINGLEFPKGQFIVSPEATLQLNRLIDILREYPELKIEIAAYTSSVGDDLENLELTRARAGAIMAQLINHGISKERLSSNGYGESRLLNHCSNDSNCSAKEHEVNERVEVRVF